jgi:hypothetical protein
LESIKIPIESIKAYIIAMDHTSLGDRNITVLKDIVPTDEERDIISTYTGDVTLLSKVDRFFYELSDIPYLKSRMETWHFMLHLSETIALVAPDLEMIGKACAELTCSQKWLDVLRIIMQMGNFLNQGGNQVDAFKMSSLAKLMELKSADNKTVRLFMIH